VVRCSTPHTEGKNMVSEITLTVNTIKGQPEPQLECLIGEIASRLMPHDRLVGELRRLLEPEGVRLKQDRQEFLVAVILACVLADIGTQPSHSARISNTAKIRSICAGRGLQYPELVRGSAHADFMLQLIDAHIGGE